MITALTCTTGLILGGGGGVMTTNTNATQVTLQCYQAEYYFPPRDIAIIFANYSTLTRGNYLEAAVC